MANNLDDDLNKLQEELAALAPKARAIPQHVPIPTDTARYHFTQIVLWAFLLFIAALVAIIQFDYVEAHVSILTDILKTMLLPLVTLMIGHYFGAKSN
jgi:hypothetical protein